MAVNFQVAIDCADPDLLANFWASALGYVLEPAPAGFDSWDDYWRDVGVAEAELGFGADLIVDPDAHGPRIHFHIVPEAKTIKNRLHFDIHASGGRTVPIEPRRGRIEAEAGRLAALGATRIRTIQTEGVDHYVVAMTDPEGNDFDIN